MQAPRLLLGGPVRQPLDPDAERRPGRAAEAQQRPQRQARPLLRSQGQGLQTPHESGSHISAYRQYGHRMHSNNISVKNAYVKVGKHVIIIFTNTLEPTHKVHFLLTVYAG